MINMGKKATGAPANTPPPSPPSPKPSEDSGSRLKINMGGKGTLSPSSVEVVKKPEKKEETGGESSFFNTPGSL